MKAVQATVMNDSSVVEQQQGLDMAFERAVGECQLEAAARQAAELVTDALSSRCRNKSSCRTQRLQQIVEEAELFNEGAAPSLVDDSAEMQNTFVQDSEVLQETVLAAESLTDGARQSAAEGSAETSRG